MKHFVNSGSEENADAECGSPYGNPPHDTIPSRDTEIALLNELSKTRKKEINILYEAVAESQKLLGKRMQDLQTVIAERDLLLQRLAKIESATSWKITYPIRQLFGSFPLIRRFIRGIVKIIWWSATGRIRQKLQSRHHEIKQSPFVARRQINEVDSSDYDRWITEFDTLNADDILMIRIHITRMRNPPKISIVMPVYETPEDFLEAAIASVQAQFYPYWELCICDDASPSGHVARILETAARNDPRIRIMRRSENGNICKATNDALALATGEFVALMDHDDLIPVNALYAVASEILANPDIDILFTDEDRISDDGRRHTPYFKPGWNPELLLGHNLVSHLGVYRRSLLKKIGGLRAGFEGSQDYDLALRAYAMVGNDRVRHLPGIFYHWRLTEKEEKLSFSQVQLDRCVIASQLAVTEFLRGRGDFHGAGAFVGKAPAVPNWLRVRWPLPYPLPKVSIIIPTRDRHELLAGCLEGVLNRTDYANLEVLVADNDSEEAETFTLFAELCKDSRVRVKSYPGPFNYAAINNAAVRDTDGDILLLLNNDIEVIGSEWLSEMISIAVRPEVGAVGAKLLYANDTIQHAGVVLGVGNSPEGPGVAGHFGCGEDRSSIGYFGQNALSRDMAAVTGACLAVRRTVFERAGGLDEENLAIAFNDVDLCLRIGAMGLRVIWTPYAELYHLESASRGLDIAPEKLKRFNREAMFMRKKWGAILDRDPFYNPVFSRSVPLFQPTLPRQKEPAWTD